MGEPATVEDVATYLGRDLSAADSATVDQDLALVTEFVRSYTRSRGFDGEGLPEADVRAVIITACGRLVENPTMGKREEIGDYSTMPGTLEGWTLPELAVLHRYRRRTA